MRVLSFRQARRPARPSRRYGVLDEPHRWPFARMTPTETSTVVVVPGSHLMSALLGQRDSTCARSSGTSPTPTSDVRGNEIALSGERHRAVGAAVRGTGRSARARARARRAHARPLDRHGPRRRAPDRGAHPRGAAGRQGPPGASEDRRPEALRRRDPRQHHHVRHRPGRHRQVVAGGGDGGAGAAGQAGAAHHPHPPAVEAGERLGFLPAT